MTRYFNVNSLAELRKLREHYVSLGFDFRAVFSFGRIMAMVSK